METLRILDWPDGIDSGNINTFKREFGVHVEIQTIKGGVEFASDKMDWHNVFDHAWVPRFDRGWPTARGATRRSGQSR